MNAEDVERQYEKVAQAAEDEARCELWLLDHLPVEEVFREFPVADEPDR
jgi:hypothetical protein